jgi:hypothetical protein
VLTWAVSLDVAASEWFGDFIVPGGMDGWNGWGYYYFLFVFMLVLLIDAVIQSSPLYRLCLVV